MVFALSPQAILITLLVWACSRIVRHSFIHSSDFFFQIVGHAALGDFTVFSVPSFVFVSDGMVEHCAAGGSVYILLENGIEY